MAVRSHEEGILELVERMPEGRSQEAEKHKNLAHSDLTFALQATTIKAVRLKTLIDAQIARISAFILKFTREKDNKVDVVLCTDLNTEIYVVRESLEMLRKAIYPHSTLQTSFLNPTESYKLHSVLYAQEIIIEAIGITTERFIREPQTIRRVVSKLETLFTKLNSWLIVETELVKGWNVPRIEQRPGQYL